MTAKINLPPTFIKSLLDTREALADPGRGFGVLDLCLPDGTDATSVKEVAALMQVDDHTAAMAVLQAKVSDQTLLMEAKDVYAASGASGRAMGIGTVRHAARPVLGRPGADSAALAARRRRRRKRKAQEKALYPPETSEYSNSICIMIDIDPVDAESIAMLGGTPAEELHVTLGWYGDIREDQKDKRDEWLGKVVGIAKQYKAFPITLNGITRFSTPNKLGRDPIVLNADSPVIEDLRRAVVDTFGRGASEHGYSPHMTVGYMSAADKTSLPRFTAKTAVATGLHLSWGETDHHEPFNKHDTETKPVPGVED